MAASGFTLESVKQFIIGSGGKVKNHELVTHFKSFLNDQSRKDEMREKFKNYVNELATIKLDEQGEKLLVLKKKYRLDSGGADWDQSRACSEPPTDMAQRSHADRPDGNMSSRVKSDGNLSASDLRLSTSTLSTATDSASLASTLSTTSLDSTVTPEEDNNMSVVSVKERAKHLNRMESESEIQKTAVSPLSATRKKDLKKSKDKDDGYESASSSGYVSLDPLEKEWIVTSSAADYHPMHQLLSKNPHLAKLKDFSGGYTALHWACKHGRPEVVKLLMGKPGVNVNQRTNGGYTPLHIAAIHGHEEIIELLVQGFKADPNIRDYSGKKAKQYLRNSASSRAQRKSGLFTPTDITDCVTTSIELPGTTSGSVVLRRPAKPSISKPSEFRRVKGAEDLISSPSDFRHVQSANFSDTIGGFGSGSLRASVKLNRQSLEISDTHEQNSTDL